MTRRKFTPAFKARVAIEALKEQKSLADLAQQFNISPQQISNWKREFLMKADTVFSTKKLDVKSEAEQREEDLLKTIGEQKVAIDFLKKSLGLPR